MVKQVPNSLHRVPISKTRRRKQIADALKNSVSRVKTFFKHPSNDIFNHYKKQVTGTVKQILLREYPEKMKLLGDHDSAISVNNKEEVVVLFGDKNEGNFPIQVKVNVYDEDLEFTFINQTDYRLQDPAERKVTEYMETCIEQEEARRIAQAHPTPSLVRKLTSCCFPSTPDYSRTNSSILYQFTNELSDYNKLTNQETLSSLNISQESEKRPMITMGIPVVLGTQV